MTVLLNASCRRHDLCFVSLHKEQLPIEAHRAPTIESASCCASGDDELLYFLGRLQGLVASDVSQFQRPDRFVKMEVFSSCTNGCSGRR